MLPLLIAPLRPLFRASPLASALKPSLPSLSCHRCRCHHQQRQESSLPVSALPPALFHPLAFVACHCDRQHAQSNAMCMQACMEHVQGRTGTHPHTHTHPHTQRTHTQRSTDAQMHTTSCLRVVEWYHQSDGSTVQISQECHGNTILAVSWSGTSRRSPIEC